MSGSGPRVAEHQPGVYRAPVSTWWWLARPAYVAFVLREISCVFVAWSVVFLMLLVESVGDGRDGYADFLAWAATPWVVALNVLTLAFVVYHAVTWYQLTPAAVVVRLGGRRLPAAAIMMPAFGGWAVVSAFVAWLLLRG